MPSGDARLGGESAAHGPEAVDRDPRRGAARRRFAENPTAAVRFPYRVTNKSQLRPLAMPVRPELNMLILFI